MKNSFLQFSTDMLQKNSSFKLQMPWWNTLLLMLGISLLAISGCTTTSVARVSTKHGEAVKMYISKTPITEYEEIAYIEVFGSIYASKQRLMDKLAERAKQLDCNAVVNVEYKYEFIYPIATGVAVRPK